MDGIDYNILLRSLNALSQEGITLPQIPITTLAPTKILLPTHMLRPTIPVKKVTIASSSALSKKSGGKSGSAGIIFLFIFLILLGASGSSFIFKKR